MLPTLVYRLLELPEAKQHDLSSLRTIVYGGAPMSPAKLRQAQERLGNIFVQVYGATECLTTAAMLTKADHLAAGDAKHLSSPGRLSTVVEIKIVDEANNEVKHGETGEIWLRSRGTITGYLNNPDGTAAEFQDGFWKSGDLGYLDDRGFLYLVDRKKDMIITGGFNVYAVEGGAALNAHPAVAISPVVGVPHSEGGEAVHAEVVLKEGALVAAEELIEHVKSKVGRFKAPKAVVFVEQLPVSVVGKVLRRHVRDKYWKDQTRRVS